MPYDIQIFKAGERVSIKLINDFLKLPKLLYSENELMQNEKSERALLKGKHTLSHYFTLYAAVAYEVSDGDRKPLGRCTLTVYPDDDTAYFGHFECAEKDPALPQQMLDKLEEFARLHRARRILGPVDASFWLRYRFKSDSRFGAPYSCEPYNRDYYPSLLTRCGFVVSERYVSNHYIVPHDEGCEKYTDRLKVKLTEGYRIESPTARDFDKVLREVYGLLIELYSGFPAYKRITEEEFCALYGSLRHIIDYSMVKMAYFGDKPVGFFISIPNYGSLISGSITLKKLVKIQRIRKAPESYVMLYMGVDPSHRGLGKALAESIRGELKQKGAPSVGALIRESNSNRDYMAQLRDFQYEYTLYERGCGEAAAIAPAYP